MRAPSFAERIKQADSSQDRRHHHQNQLWSYTSTDARMELKNKTRVQNRSSQPDEDVDTAFHFLDNYGYKDE